tara:strand:+ start:5629 stop:6282 length:654 start_codon:yes stop_codon:yes gene_type:complete
MYKLKFDYINNTLPVLYLNDRPVIQDGYIIGSNRDPHWRPYPKEQFYSLRDQAPLGTAVTDYPYDANHFAYYSVANVNETAPFTYSRLLKAHFDEINRAKYQHVRDGQRILDLQRLKLIDEQKEKNKNRIKQITSQRNTFKSQLKAAEESFKVMSTKNTRGIKRFIKDGYNKNEAQVEFLKTLTPTERQAILYAEGNLNVLKQNIKTLESELKELKN